MAAPSDPCVPCVGEIWLGYDGDLEGAVLSFSGSTPRATLVASVARELDVGFTDLVAVVRYARPMTRQEVWDDSGREGWLDQWMHDNGVGYYFQTNSYHYDMVMADGSARVPGDDTEARDLKQAFLPEAKEPPPDWQPDRCYATIKFVDDPNGDYPTQVERVLVVEA